MSKQRIRLSIFLNQPAFFDGQTYTFNYINLVDFFASSAHEFDQLVIGLPVCVTESSRGRMAMNFPSHVRVLRFPYYNGHRDMMQRGYRIIPGAILPAWKLARESDIVGCVAPSVIGNLVALAARISRKPLFFLIRGNKRATFQSIYGSRLAGITVQTLFRSYSWLTALLIRTGTPAFVIGSNNDVASGKHVALLTPVLNPLFFSALPDGHRSVESSSPRRLLYVGRLSREKGLGYLLRALADLLQEGLVNWRLYLVGEGAEEMPLRCQAEELGLDDHVKFIGALPQDESLLSQYLSADIFVLPSLTEGVPRALLEAMGSGLPVIATSVGGVPDVIQHGENGLLVPPADCSALTQALKQLLRDTNLCVRLGEAARETAKTYTFEYQSKVMVAKLAEWFPDVLLDSSVER